jgi:enoyl-CoA hydratase/carnithine racemase
MPSPPPGTAERLRSLPFVLVGLRSADSPLPPPDTPAPDDGWLNLCDVVVAEHEPARRAIEQNLETVPIAATALALLLRGQRSRGSGDGLVAESATYSVLQAGPEFAAWRARTPARTDRDDDTPRVRLDRRRDAAGDTLSLTLTRPARLNALDSVMRDALVEALTTVVADPTVAAVELRGEGRAFCAGGDLNEFGTRPDPARAHLVRLQRSVARALIRVGSLGKATTAYIHGPTVGSGIELAACADRVVAAPDTEIALPEIGLGLVPGAGGTVSLPRRIGRLGTAWLAFSGLTIDAETALAWGLVDEIAA